MIDAFVPLAVSRLVVGLEPASSTAFLFTNAKRDGLLLYCVDEDGDRVIQKKLEKGAFLLPAPESEGAAYVSLKRSMLSRLFRH